MRRRAAPARPLGRALLHPQPAELRWEELIHKPPRTTVAAPTRRSGVALCWCQGMRRLLDRHLWSVIIVELLKWVGEIFQIMPVKVVKLIMKPIFRILDTKNST